MIEILALQVQEKQRNSTPQIGNNSRIFKVLVLLVIIVYFLQTSTSVTYTPT